MPQKVREAIREVQADGWYLDRQRGSRRIFRHPTKPGMVTIPGHPRDDLHRKTDESIRDQAGLD